MTTHILVSLHPQGCVKPLAPRDVVVESSGAASPVKARAIGDTIRPWMDGGFTQGRLARVAAAEPDWQPTTLCTTKLEEHVNARVRRGDPLSPSPQLVNPDAHHFAIRVTRSICVRYSHSACASLRRPFFIRLRHSAKRAMTCVKNQCWRLHPHRRRSMSFRGAHRPRDCDCSGSRLRNLGTLASRQVQGLVSRCTWASGAAGAGDSDEARARCNCAA